ncbi:MAG: Gfo/Idh/MocA family oxidoreductase [Planctomycetes bacterium]|nr:Gfo/Idh/MocA family oxidoreductase [Planctomycetota bacterium]
MTHRASRREFLGYAAAAAAATWIPACQTNPRRRILTLNDKLNIGVIGVGGRGNDNLHGVAGENIVAICDVDENNLAGAAKEFPNAKRFVDFRELVLLQSLDAIVVSTPDHTHAPAAAAGLRRGLDVYCEKPLAHNVHEVRTLTELARKYGAVTQMGTQIHDHANFRRVVELIQSKAIGDVKECHVFVNGTNWSKGERAKERVPPPNHLHYDLWLGPAEEQSYDPSFHPAGWRRWWAFGNGTLGDMACHYMDLAFWALQLKYPKTIEAEGPAPDPETAPDRLKISYTFPERENLPPVNFTWYDGHHRPEILKTLNLEKWINGVLFIGERGNVIANYDNHELIPGAKAIERPKPWIPDSVGHHREWIEACKNRGTTSCNFNYSGPLTETVLLGAVAFRTGTRLEWDAESFKIKNSEAANGMLRQNYRSGWTL